MESGPDESDFSLQKTAIEEKGWCRFPVSAGLTQWVRHSLGAARAAVHATEYRKWLRCGRTWFVGVNALPNDERGAVPGGPQLQGPAVDFITRALGFGEIRWDRAQVSVCYPGYPRPSAEESEAAYRYRVVRAAAHVDGILPEGPDRRRFLRQYHAFILGIPMVDVSRDAAPFTIWEGSHEIVRSAFEARLQSIPLEQWGGEDITDTYHALRHSIFDTCKRVAITAKPGEAYVVHRLALHGIAPWAEKAKAGEDGRMICYFRPELIGAESWLSSR